MFLRKKKKINKEEHLSPIGFDIEHHNILHCYGARKRGNHENEGKNCFVMQIAVVLFTIYGQFLSRNAVILLLTDVTRIEGSDTRFYYDEFGKKYYQTQ